MRSCCALLLLPACALAIGSQQLDWSGGPGVPGPVTYWEEYFSGNYRISWAGAGGYLVLGCIPLMHWIHSDGVGCHEMDVVDIDGDGDLDVAGCRSTWDKVFIWENLDGQGGSWADMRIADSLDTPKSIDAADIDQDGDWDLVVSTFVGSVWLENAGEQDWPVHPVGSTEAWCVRAGDIDGDDDIDVIACETDPDYEVFWCENLDGSGGAWQEHLIVSGGMPNFVRLVDVDGDSDLDVLASFKQAPKVVFFENSDGSGGEWVEHIIAQNVGDQYNWLIDIAPEDIDQDGDTDIAVSASYQLPEGLVVWYENTDGAGLIWQIHTVDNDLSGVSSIEAADLDADGDADLMACSGAQWGEELVAWYENVEGDGSAWNRHELTTTMDAPCDVMGRDIDQDGDLDVVVAQNNIMRWYEFSRATSGWLESSILDPPGGSQEQWTDLGWEAAVPPGTILTFQVRASNDPSDMGEWSPAFAVPGSLAPYLPDPGWYFQYRVNMVTGVPPITPVLDEVLVQYDPVGIEGAPDGSEPSLTILSGNPSPGAITFDVYLPEAGQVSLRIFDIAGRVVIRPLSGQIEAGHQELTVTDLPIGCYRAVLTTDSFGTEAWLTVLR